MSTKNAGGTMVAAIFQSVKRSGNAREGLSIETLAKAADLSLKDAYSRLWWLEKKEGALVSTGKGAEKVYRLAAATLKELVAAEA